MEDFHPSDARNNQETIDFSDDFSSSLIDRAVNSEAAQELDDKYSEKREAIESDKIKTKRDIIASTVENTSTLASEIPEKSVDSSEYFSVQDAI